MKFIFKNLGPIHEAELELGDLTIIAGRNNTGKTYVAYTLYGFLKMFSDVNSFFLESFGSLDYQRFSSDLTRDAKTFMEEGQLNWPLPRERLDILREGGMYLFAQTVSKKILMNVFNASDEEFKNTWVYAVLEEEIPEYLPSKTFSIPMGGEVTLTYSNDEVCIRRSKASKTPLSPETLMVVLSALCFTFIFPELPKPFILSAERFGISLFYKELDFTKSRVVELMQSAKDREAASDALSWLIDTTVSRYAMPIKDNIDYTRDISYLQRHRGELHDSKLFKDIENMMKGYYRSSGDEIRFRSKARKGGFDIPLHVASTSARGLSDLYFFLRHVAKKGQLLIIDEPESHLDTANQIQFARLLARAVHAGLKVLITTHSDYIVKEINNLLMLSQDFEEKDEVLKKLKYSEHDYLKPESVRAYVAEKNSLTPCTIEKYGIDMPVFDTTIDKINRVSSELSVRLKYEGEG